MKKVLYISGSLGLGHITRDLVIARELRRRNPDIDLRWLAAEPAKSVVVEAGEKLIPEAEEYTNDSDTAENVAQDTKLNMTKYAFRSLKAWESNVQVLRRVMSQEQYHLVIGDEAYEVVAAILRKWFFPQAPFVMIYDFVGLDATTSSPSEKLGVYFWNRIWSQDHKIFSLDNNLALFIGELEDIPDKTFGFLLPNRRQYAWRYYKFIGYVLPFNPDEYSDKEKGRQKLGYGDEPLVICSIGGIAVGKRLLELCGQAYVLIKRRIPRLRMVLVCGPRLPASSLDVPQEVEVRQYVPNLFEHFAVSDLAIVQAGGTTTLELTALRRPFLYFPLEGHSEQEITVAGRLQRHQAGLRMSYAEVTPWSLALAIEENIGRQAKYRPIPVDGAGKAAQMIDGILSLL